MRTPKKNIGIVIYANPDDYPPTIRAVNILSKEFDIIIICRNQNVVQQTYPNNVRLYRLGKLKSARGKEEQGLGVKILEYLSFIIRAIFYLRFYGCQVIYSYDMHGFIAGFLASRFGKKIPLIYHNHDLVDLDKTKGLNYIIKSWELRLAPYADRIVFPDINRARFFKEEVKLNKLPDIVMNTPLRINALPSNRLKEALEVKGFNANAKVVLYQGVISETQSILEVIKSMALWPKNTVLVLLGYISGDFLEKVYDITKSLDLAQRVIYIPSVRYPDYTNYTIGGYIGLALYKPINTNFKFNCGASNKLFEYISLGIPVITNDSVYFKEVLDSSYAYFARPDSVEDIGRVVNSVFLDEEEYSRKCQAARDIHLTRFNYEEQFRPVVEYIRQTTEYGE